MIYFLTKNALKLAESYIKEKGLPEDVELYMAEKVELKALDLRTMEIVENKLLFVSIKYKRCLDGLSVIGPGDEIELAVAKEVLYFSKEWKKIGEGRQHKHLICERCFREFESRKNHKQANGDSLPANSA